MAEPKIDFRKIRDLGQNISDTFLFIKQQSGPLLKSFFAICAILILAQSIAAGINQAHSIGILDALFRGGGQRAGMPSAIFGAAYFITILLTLVTYIAMQVVLGAYIKFYVETGSQPGIQDVWNLFKRYFLRVSLYSICLYFVFLISFVACILPGIYMGIVMAPFTMVIMMEDKDLVGTFQRCFELIKEHFWSSFAIYLIGYIIYSVGSVFIGLATSLVGGLIAYLTTSDISTSVGVVTSFLNSFSLCFYLFYFISVAFNYFSLVESRDAIGLLGRIDQIGNQPANNTNINDQY